MRICADIYGHGPKSLIASIYSITVRPVILALRTWAIWGRDACFGLGLGVALVAIWLPVLVLSHRFLRSLVCEWRPPYALLSPCSDPRIYAVSPAARGCFLTGGSVTTYVAIYALFLASDTRESARMIVFRDSGSEGGRGASAVVLGLTLAKCLQSSESMPLSRL